MKKDIQLPAKLEELDRLIDDINAELEAADCPMKEQMQIAIAAEEIFVNIAHYAYAPETGDATVTIEIADAPRAVTITFVDSGVAFDPLAKPDPDITEGAEGRKIGGLGIYMVKKSMDRCEYRRDDGKNIFAITKNF